MQTLNQKFQIPNKKATISLMLGIISFLPIIILKIILPHLRVPLIIPFSLPFVPIIILFITIFITPLLSIIGLISGILGLKSEKRNIAKIGIILCTTGLLLTLYYFLSD